MKNIIRQIGKQIICLKSKIYFFLSIMLFLSFNYSDGQTFLRDNIQVVPVFYPVQTNFTYRFLFWDLTEVNDTNNRLDLGVGVDHLELEESYISGNWYKNENDSNFNSEVTGDRFIYLFI